MNLLYRGVAYQSSSSVTSKASTQQIGRFLGNPFEIKRFTVTHKHPYPVHLKYRGIDYEA